MGKVDAETASAHVPLDRRKAARFVLGHHQENARRLGRNLASWDMVVTSIPLFPLNTVLFPDGFLPLQIFEVRYLDMVNKCISDGSEFGVVLLTQGSEVRTPGGEESLAGTGTMARIGKWKAPLPGLLQIGCIGTRRFEISSSQRLKHGLWVADVIPIENDRAVSIPEELQGAADELGKLIDSLRQDGVPQDELPIAPPYRLEDCGWVANRWCELLALPNEQKQDLLTLDNPLLRLELVHDVLSDQGWLA